MQVYEAGAGFVGEGFGEHGFAAARGAVEQDARGRGEERGRVRVEVWEGERVDDGFFELFDYGVEAADVVERDGYLLWRNNFHGYCLLVRVEIQVLYPRPSAPPLVLVVAVIVSAAVFLSPLPGQYGVEFASRGRGFGACFFLLLCFRVESRQEVAYDEVCY